jgi:hypothetical protein
LELLAAWFSCALATTWVGEERFTQRFRFLRCAFGRLVIGMTALLLSVFLYPSDGGLKGSCIFSTVCSLAGDVGSFSVSLAGVPTARSGAVGRQNISKENVHDGGVSSGKRLSIFEAELVRYQKRQNPWRFFYHFGVTKISFGQTNKKVESWCTENCGKFLIKSE